MHVTEEAKSGSSPRAVVAAVVAVPLSKVVSAVRTEHRANWLLRIGTAPQPKASVRAEEVTAERKVVRLELAAVVVALEQPVNRLAARLAARAAAQTHLVVEEADTKAIKTLPEMVQQDRVPAGVPAEPVLARRRVLAVVAAVVATTVVVVVVVTTVEATLALREAVLDRLGPTPVSVALRHCTIQVEAPVRVHLAGTAQVVLELTEPSHSQ